MCFQRYSDILLKNINFIFPIDKTFRVIEIMDFNRTEPTCYSTIFPYASNAVFLYIVLALHTSEACF